MHADNVPTGAIIVAAFTGLGIGLLLNIFFLKRWVAAFYTANAFLMVAIYLGLSTIALAVFMGLPVGTFALGILAGAYVGRKQRHLHPGSDMISQSLTRVSLLAASLTTALAVPIGFMALGEPITRQIEIGLGLTSGLLVSPVGWASVVVVCVVLFGLQYYCAKVAGRFAFRIMGKTPNKVLNAAR